LTAIYLCHPCSWREPSVSTVYTAHFDCDLPMSPLFLPRYLRVESLEQVVAEHAARAGHPGGGAVLELGVAGALAAGLSGLRFDYVRPGLVKRSRIIMQRMICRHFGLAGLESTHTHQYCSRSACFAKQAGRACGRCNRCWSRSTTSPSMCPSLPCGESDPAVW
jgi:hypothetical protein